MCFLFSLQVEARKFTRKDASPQKSPKNAEKKNFHFISDSNTANLFSDPNK